MCLFLLLTEWWDVGMVVCDEVQTLHIAQQMPLPLTISCSSKSRMVLTCLVLPFWYLLTRVVPDIFQKSSKTVVCVCVFLLLTQPGVHGYDQKVADGCRVVGQFHCRSWRPG